MTSANPYYSIEFEATISDSELIPNIILLACTFNHLAGSTNTIGVLDLRINTNGWNFRGDQKEKADETSVWATHYNYISRFHNLQATKKAYSGVLLQASLGENAHVQYNFTCTVSWRENDDFVTDKKKVCVQPVFVPRNDTKTVEFATLGEQIATYVTGGAVGVIVAVFLIYLRFLVDKKKGRISPFKTFCQYVCFCFVPHEEGSLEKMMVEFEQEKQRRKTVQNGEKPENETTLGNMTLMSDNPVDESEVDPFAERGPTTRRHTVTRHWGLRGVKDERE